MKKHTFRNHFLAGLAVILPLWATLGIFWLLFKWSSGLTAPIFSLLFGFLLDGHQHPVLVRFIGLLCTIFIVWVVGLLTAGSFGKKIFSWLEKIFLKIPFLREIYNSISKLLHFIFTHKTSFRQVVLVQFPRKGIYSIGFVTMEGIREFDEKTGQQLVNVFVPHSPSPTTGYVLLVPKQEVIILSISVEHAFRLIISGGVIPPGESRKSAEQSQESKQEDMLL
jgi:uncharacterized membrane protein